MSQITDNDWYTIYKPVVNHLNPNASWGTGDGGIMFETYGEELEYVTSKVDENRVWTWLEGDDGSTVVSAGFSFVNRLGYFITEKPWDDLNQWWQAEEPEVGECDVCEAPDGEPHCDCGQCDCGEGE